MVRDRLNAARSSWRARGRRTRASAVHAHVRTGGDEQSGEWQRSACSEALPTRRALAATVSSCTCAAARDASARVSGRRRCETRVRTRLTLTRDSASSTERDCKERSHRTHASARAAVAYGAKAAALEKVNRCKGNRRRRDGAAQRAIAPTKRGTARKSRAACGLNIA
eukprot:6202153-Pleurochrysis_carterae.AAC.5